MDEIVDKERGESTLKTDMLGAEIFSNGRKDVALRPCAPTPTIE